MAAILATVCGCASTPQLPFVLSPPAYEIDESFAPEGGIAQAAGAAAPHPRDTEAHPGSALGRTAQALRCRVFYLAQPPTESGLRPAASGTALVADLLGAEPITETPNLTAQVLFADGPEGNIWLERALASGPLTSIANRSFELPIGASYRLGLTVMETIEDPRDWLDEFADRGPIPRRLGVEIFAGHGGPTIAVEITDISPDAERALRKAIEENPNLPPARPAPAHTESLRREAVTLDASLAGKGPVVVRVPSPFDTGNGSTFAIVVESLAPDQVFVKAAEAQARAALDALAQSTRAIPLTSAGRKALQREEALQAFVDRGGRAALLLLAEEAEAPLCADLALSAEAGFLDVLAKRAFPELHESSQVEGKSESPPPTAAAEGPSGPLVPDPTDSDPTGSDPTGLAPLDPGTIGWRLDATAWSMIAESALDETLSPELEGVLLRRAGALARFPDLIQDLLRSSGGDLGAFERGLITEHLIALEDSGSSVRLRAHDWLMERGLAVQGFDPLGERSARRAALEAFREKARTSLATTSSGNGGTR